MIRTPEVDFVQSIRDAVSILDAVKIYQNHNLAAHSGCASRPITEKCEHDVAAKHCFRCKRPDLAGPPPPDINTSNAIAQERARIREEVLRLHSFNGHVSRKEVLEVIRNDQEV